MKRLLTYRLLPTALLLAASAAATADVVEIPIGQQTEAASITTPATGQTKAKVLASYGEPNSKSGPVGEPAIYRWSYGNFVVYFEDDWVIHSVVKFTRKNTPKEQTET